jgi:hypothetical protein
VPWKSSALGPRGKTAPYGRREVAWRRCAIDRLGMARVGGRVRGGLPAGGGAATGISCLRSTAGKVEWLLALGAVSGRSASHLDSTDAVSTVPIKSCVAAGFFCSSDGWTRLPRSAKCWRCEPASLSACGDSSRLIVHGAWMTEQNARRPGCAAPGHSARRLPERLYVIMPTFALCRPRLLFPIIDASSRRHNPDGPTHPLCRGERRRG